MKKYFTICVLLVVVIFYTKATNNYTQTIRGKVIEEVTGLPITGATVILLNSDPVVGTTTDVNGEFVIENIPIGRQGIEVSFIGYHTVVINNLLLNSGKETQLDIRLIEKVLEVEEVTVKAFNRKDKTVNDMAMISARSFTVEETERFAGSLGDPARMVANYAGVMTQNDQRNDIIIRGNSPIGLLWRLDGIEIPNPNHFGALGTTGGPVSMLNNNLLTNSDFITGAFPAEYGNALAGAFDLNMRPGNNANTEYTGQIGFNGFEAGVEGPVNIKTQGAKPSYIANFRYSTLEVMNKMGMDFGTGTAIPQYKDLTFKFNLPSTKAGTFKLIGLWGKSFIDLDTIANAYGMPGAEIRFGSDLAALGLSHSYYFSDKAKLNTIISAQNTISTTDIDSVNRYNKDNPKLFYYGIMEESKLSLSSSYKYKISSKNNIEFGLYADEYYIDYVDSVISFENTGYEIQTQSKGDLFLFRSFAQWQHRFNERLTAYMGAHYMYFGLNGESTIEPRLSLQWKFSEKSNITAGFGVHSQIQPRMVYFLLSHDSITGKSFETNHDIKFSKSNHYVLGYNYLINKDFRFKVETYYQYLYNIPVREGEKQYSILNSGADFGVWAFDSLINKGTGENYGLEITLEKFLSKSYYFLFTASIFNSTYTDYYGDTYNTAFNGNYVFNLLGGYEFKVGKYSMITFDMKTVWAGGKRKVPLDLELSQQNKRAEYDYDQAFEKKYNDYFRTDFRIGFKMNKAKYSQEWGLDLQNIFGYRSQFSEVFDPFKGENGEIIKTYQQGFFPMMLYRINF